MSELPDKRCILCQEEIPEKTKPEHILLNALGGRMTVRNIICPSCNHTMGIGPDNDLAESVALLRNTCQLKAGDGGNPPIISGMETDGQKFDLIPGLRPRLRNPKALSLEVCNGGIRAKINAYSEAEADKLMTGAAKAIAKHVGRSEPEAVDVIKADIATFRTSSFIPAPRIQGQLAFGSEEAQRSMAKACLVLLAKQQGNREVNSIRYDVVRAFIQTGAKSADLVKLDFRSMPELPKKYGTNPNVIWVGSDSDGKVYGYFRLYNALGWRFSLCDEAEFRIASCCLISNPFDNKVWDLLEQGESPISPDWVRQEWNVQLPSKEYVQSVFAPMIRMAHKKSEEDWMRKVIEEGLVKAGCNPGDEICYEHIEKFSDYVSRALSAYLLNTCIPEDD